MNDTQVGVISRAGSIDNVIIEEETKISKFKYNEVHNYVLKTAKQLRQNIGIVKKEQIKIIEAKTCRICLSEEDPLEIENPLITPCNCAGSMGFIHVDCLKQWLESKKIVKYYPQVTSYCWKNLECELCKYPFPTMSYSKKL